MRDDTSKRGLLVTSAAALLLALAGCAELHVAGPGQLCEEGETMCFDQVDHILRCDDQGTWRAELCGEGLLCHEDECRELTCVPGTKSCVDGAVVECDADGQGLSEPIPCPEGELCHDGECLPLICEDGEKRCADEQVLERCTGAGTTWETHRVCPEGTSCADDALCLPSECEPGAAECGLDRLYVCDESGSWRVENCGEDQVCVLGRCVSCITDDHCEEGKVCVGGECEATTPRVTTESLPEGTIGSPYEERLQAEGGRPPYEWSLIEGELPAGLLLTETGRLHGTPSTVGTSELTVEVADALGGLDRSDYTLRVVAVGDGPTITTASITPADHGLPYEFMLRSSGGEAPHAWQILQGALPDGIGLSSTGRLTGIPDEIGDFPFTVRVIDAATPPGLDVADLTLTVNISPLVIIGDQEYDLFVTKVIILPMLVPFVPYSERLQAQGGLRPYAWTEADEPPGVGFLIPEWGMPSDLSLASDGRISGWVTDVSDATEVSIPFTDINLKGYFFSARVTDSQNPAESVEAVFCIPTVPL